jgi:hypothetical protein
MTITTTRLGQAAGIATAVAGAIFIAVQINHPAMDLASVSTTDWVVRNGAKALMAALALAGITGLYLRQRTRVGLVGLMGYLVLSAGYLLMFGTQYLATFALPSAVDTAPGWVSNVIVAAFGGTPTGDIGALSAVFAATGVCYMLGGLVFGLATFRAGILARWAAVLLAVGNVSTLALSVLPDSFNRPMAVPTGIALIGLGVSLWRDQRREAASAASVTSAAAAPAATSAPVSVR